MILFVKRNLQIFFRDRASVFFSLLAVLILIGLYVLFLSDAIGSGLAHFEQGRFLMDSWIMAGVLAVGSITTTMGAAGIAVDDKSTGVAKDFQASPLKRSIIVGGYLFSIIVVGVVMSLAALIVAELFIVLNGGAFLPWISLAKVVGLILLSAAASGSIVFVLVSFFKNQSAFGVASTVLGTLVGFLMGIYIPLGSLPQGVQWVIKLFPLSHTAALLRQVFMAVPLQHVFAGAPEGVMLEFQTSMGVVYQFGDNVFSARGSVLVLLATTVVFFALGVLRMLRNQS